MFQLAHRTASHDGGSMPPADGSSLVFISTQEVIFNTGVDHHHSAVSKLLGAISHIHVKLPEPHPIYQRANYFDAGRMSRLMEHL